MKGYIRVAAATPKIRVAAVGENSEAIMRLIKEADDNNVKILVLPKNCLTSNTLGDLAYSSVIADAVEDALTQIAAYTIDRDMVVFLGTSLPISGTVLSGIVGISGGEILGILTDELIVQTRVKIGSCSVLAASDIYFKEYKSGVTICNGGTNICILCQADKELMGTQSTRLTKLMAETRDAKCGVIYAGAGEGESDTDYICGGARIIAECGDIVESSDLLTTGLTVSELDLGRICLGQSFKGKAVKPIGTCVEFNLIDVECFTITRHIPKYPFLPLENTLEQFELCFKIQSTALASRMAHIKSDNLVLGVSGGLDSSLALLVCMRACDKLGKSYKNIVAVTMPGFGTAKESLERATKLIDAIGATKKIVDITAGVTAHLAEIGHKKKADTTYENAQARYRTMALMDIANSVNGLVVGTGDMSELALGWCTFGGDHISNYNVNAGVPKTLVIELVKYEAARLIGEVQEQLNAVLAARISPELLPAGADGKVQDTEEILGDYKLHDFFLYYYTTCGAAPQKLQNMAERAFGEEYDPDKITNQMKLFFSRYFANQFKRSCSPDGVMVCPISLSPRNGLKMPSDVDMQLWNQQLDKIINIKKK